MRASSRDREGEGEGKGVGQVGGRGKALLLGGWVPSAGVWGAALDGRLFTEVEVQARRGEGGCESASRRQTGVCGAVGVVVMCGGGRGESGEARV